MRIKIVDKGMIVEGKEDLYRQLVEKKIESLLKAQKELEEEYPGKFDFSNVEPISSAIQALYASSYKFGDGSIWIEVNDDLHKV